MDKRNIKKMIITNFLTLDVIVVIFLFTFFKYDAEYFYCNDGECSYDNYYDLSIQDKFIDYILGKNIWS